jgi:UDP-N-acetylmuramate dehydrogenase
MTQMFNQRTVLRRLKSPGELGFPKSDKSPSDEAVPDIYPNEPLSRYSAVGIGGPADFLMIVRHREALLNAIEMACHIASQSGLPWRVFGGLTNVLIPDAGIRGVVILNRTREFNLDEATGQLYATSGVLMAPLAREMVRRGWGGLTWAVGLPGTVGGAIVNNAGAFGGEIDKTLLKAELCQVAKDAQDGGQVFKDVRQRVHTVRPEWFEFGYRYSKLKGAGSGSLGDQKDVVLSGTFQLRARDPQHLTERATAYNVRRKRTQPPGRTLGSTFKNPPGDYAGRLIEAAGLKGLRAGLVIVSAHHANFFINEGGGTAADFRALIDLVREEVHKRFGINLEIEIEIADWDRE